jgi:hypothetical protein
VRHRTTNLGCLLVLAQTFVDDLPEQIWNGLELNRRRRRVTFCGEGAKDRRGKSNRSEKLGKAVAAMDAVGVDGAVLVSPFSIYRFDVSYVLEVEAKYPDRFCLVKPAPS